MQLSLRAKKQHQLLGYLLIKTKPEIAQELLDRYTTDDTVITDHMLMQNFFREFLQSTSSFAGSKSIANRTFIASMIRVYQPELSHQPREAMVVKRGFVKHLADVLQQKPSNISAMIRQVIIWEQSYDDFRQNVMQFSSLIIEQYGQTER